MKRCPECRRDFYDDSLIFCLDDGIRLLDGSPSLDDPATALLYSTGSSGEAANRAQIDVAKRTAVLSSPESTSQKLDKRLLSNKLVLIRERRRSREIILGACRKSGAFPHTELRSRNAH